MKKHLFLATAVLAAPLLAHADLKAMDDGALSDVTGQAGISISGTFQGSVGAVTYTDTDTNGGSLRLENIRAGSFSERGTTGRCSRFCWEV